MEDAVGAIGDRLVVSDHDDGLAVVVHFLEEVENSQAGVFVEVAGGFIGEEQLRFVDHGSGDGDTLSFAAGEFVGGVVESVAEAKFTEKGDYAWAKFVEMCGEAEHGMADECGDHGVFDDVEFGE